MKKRKVVKRQSDAQKILAELKTLSATVHELHFAVRANSQAVRDNDAGGTFAQSMKSAIEQVDAMGVRLGALQTENERLKRKILGE